MSEKKPKSNKDVLLSDGKYQCVSKCQFVNNQLYIEFGRSGDMGIPLYWMDLPELPESDNEKNKSKDIKDYCQLISKDDSS